MNIIGTDHYWRDWSMEIAAGVYGYCGIDFALARANGSRFTFLKACDGIAETPFFREAYDEAVRAGLWVGAYVWLYPSKNVSVKTQAQFWHEQLKDLHCPVSIDFELYRSYMPEASDLYGAAEEWWRLDPTRKLGVYTNQWYWADHGNPDAYWLKLFNWSARYNVIPPGLYAPWNRWDFWQFTGLGDPATWGIMNGKLAVDVNYWHGTEAELADFFGGVVVPPPPPPTGDRMEATVLADKVNIRTDHNTSASDVGDLYRNQSAEVFELWETGVNKGWDYEQWGRIGDARWIAIWYRTQGKLCDLSDVVVPPPTGEGVTVEYVANGSVIHSEVAPAGSKVTISLTK